MRAAVAAPSRLTRAQAWGQRGSGAMGPPQKRSGAVQRGSTKDGARGIPPRWRSCCPVAACGPPLCAQAQAAGLAWAQPKARATPALADAAVPVSVLTSSGPRLRCRRAPAPCVRADVIVPTPASPPRPCALCARAIAPLLPALAPARCGICSRAHPAARADAASALPCAPPRLRGARV